MIKREKIVTEKRGERRTWKLMNRAENENKGLDTRHKTSSDRSSS